MYFEVKDFIKRTTLYNEKRSKRSKKEVKAQSFKLREYKEDFI
jgi:hypothetical protein